MMIYTGVFALVKVVFVKDCGHKNNLINMQYLSMKG